MIDKTVTKTERKKIIKMKTKTKKISKKRDHILNYEKHNKEMYSYYLRYMYVYRVGGTLQCTEY